VDDAEIESECVRDRARLNCGCAVDPPDHDRADICASGSSVLVSAPTATPEILDAAIQLVTVMITSSPTAAASLRTQPRYPDEAKGLRNHTIAVGDGLRKNRRCFDRSRLRAL
jgi:hypothetical protein